MFRKWNRFWKVAGMLGLLLFSTPLGGQTLQVPARSQALSLTIPVPENQVLEKGAKYALRSESSPDLMVPLHWIPSRNADGTLRESQGKFTAVIPPEKTSEDWRFFQLEKFSAPPPSSQASFSWREEGETTLVAEDGQGKILAYHYRPISRKEIADFRNTRACYIHPLWGLQGEVLTDDFPPDHYHHHGIFWAWMHVERDGKDHDLWMSKDIFQQFEQFLHRQSDSALVLGVENSWQKEGESIMTERVWIQSYPVGDGGRCLDLDLYWIPTTKAITLRGAEGKSYGGLTVRFAIPPKKGRPQITTSEGISQEDLPVCPLKWVDVCGNFAQSENGIAPENATEMAPPSGAAIFIPTDHPGDPQKGWPPTWLTRFYGMMAVGWPGVEGKTFAPGEVIHLRYRVWIHDGNISWERLNQRYEDYLATEKVSWIREP
ncbi:MAG: PmoA family protein [Planctomycetia bacterium]|nr:PmoA family protein [Planctomycetia bacterium]